MSLFRRLAVLAGAAEAARRYARSNPDKAGRALDSAAQFVDKQTGGKYTNQIAGAARKAKDVAGIPQPGLGYGAPGTTPEAPAARPPVTRRPRATGSSSRGSLRPSRRRTPVASRAPDAPVRSDHDPGTRGAGVVVCGPPRDGAG
ncbi:antitoxin [Pseudonocardia nematodicida]|uniref:Antitoxin n=1 Tax=Pseudonocardia nematodicida TaxID=1206997 RepID=A0ABV1KKF0_9PSEU